jgi:hypothetical protein
MMRIWKLYPTNPADPIWNKWSAEPIIVRAEGEAEARHLGVLKTNKTFPSIPGLPIHINPWGGYKSKGDPAPRPTLCEDITEQSNEYTCEGPAEVLHHGEKF